MVVPTPRLLLIALCGLIPMILTGSYYGALIAGAAWWVGTLLVALGDIALLPARTDLIWEREHEPKLSLGVPNLVILRLRNRARRPMRFRVRDAIPPTFLADGGAGGGTCGAGDSWEMAYRVVPTHRGDFHFGPLAVRYLGPFGLAWRQYGDRLDGEVKVYPNLLAVRSYESLLRRGRLEEMGLHLTRRHGAGTEFERLRDYSHDDEFRRINWPATARRHKPIAVDYQTERSQNILLVIDAGRLMSTTIVAEVDGNDTAVIGRGGVALTRLDHAVNSSLLLAFVAQLYGDRVGLLAFADRVSRYLPARPGRGQFLALTDALYNLEAIPIETDYTAGLGYLATRNPRRSLMVVFTDLAGPEAATPLVAHATRLARRHLVLVVTLRDPAIEHLARLALDRPEQVYERAVARRTLDDREETLLALRRHGVLTLDVPANELSPALINRYLEIKARTGL